MRTLLAQGNDSSLSQQMTSMPKFSLFLFVVIPRLYASELSAQIVDGLNRPIPGVQVEISCMSSKQQETSLRFKSDENGMVHGTYDAALCTPLSTSVEKQGYESYVSGFRSRYVLKRLFSAQDIARIVKSDESTQLRDLRERLAGTFSGLYGQNEFADSVFYYEARLRHALRTLASDPQVTERARDLLSLIAVSEDLHLIMQLAPPAPSPGFPERWRYAVATALVSPDGEDEWSFLRKCALNEFADRWVDSGAIQTLKLTGSSRSQSILEEVQQKNQMRARQITSALSYVKSNPGSLADSDLEALAKRVAEAMKIGTLKGNGPPRLNEAGDKALVDFTFQTSMDRLVHTATFHRRDGVWILRGVHETSQAFAPSGPFHPLK
jgi:hypothetical protein